MAAEGHLDDAGADLRGTDERAEGDRRRESEACAWRKVSRCTAIIEAVTAPRVRIVARSANARVRWVPVRGGGEGRPDFAPDDLPPPAADPMPGTTKACSGRDTRTWIAA